MNTPQTPGRVTQHATAFNAAVRSGDWTAFADRFTPNATMRFASVPVGPFTSREEIARAYTEQPPAETLTITSTDSSGPVDTVRFTWASGGTGTMRLTWQGQLISSLTISFDS